MRERKYSNEIKLSIMFCKDFYFQLQKRILVLSLVKVYFVQIHQQRSFGILKRFFKIIILSRAMSDHYPKAGYYRPFSEFSAFVISICIFKVVKVYYYDSLFMTHYRFKYELSFWPMRDNLTNNDRLFVS